MTMNADKRTSQFIIAAMCDALMAAKHVKIEKNWNQETIMECRDISYEISKKFQVDFDSIVDDWGTLRGLFVSHLKRALQELGE